MISVVGEALVDLIAGPDGRTFTAHPGGSPANVAVGLARLGTATALHTHLGDDLFGRFLRDHLAAEGVPVDLLPARDPGTSVAFAATDQDGVAAYDFRIGWDVTRIPAARVLHTGSLAAALAPGPVEAAMDAAATVSYDPNIRPALAGPRAAERARVERQVGKADIVKASADDLAWLYPGADPRERAADWLARGPRLVVVTLGPDGAYAVTQDGQVTRSCGPVTVVDTVGAGDSFTAALLHALDRAGALEHGSDRPEDLVAALDLANAAAAVTCGRAGADPPTADEIDYGKFTRTGGEVPGDAD
ncbi:carbohydrate kinase family protein [Actinokineospora enzanensis]|uniref:carbohydrate kinase family protein n=1 Tax=Actinokineospora enzanensis TaxID=155975 RepID=UPI00037FAAAD|nr:carbohydrate kinase [Actinokineospora enzanensis]